MLSMAKQEMRLLRVNYNKRQNEILHFKLELEEGEIEIEHLSMLEIEAFEALRRAEVTRLLFMSYLPNFSCISLTILVSNYAPYCLQ
jgi:hypothetical protein